MAISAKDVDARFGQSFTGYRAAKTAPTRHLVKVNDVYVARAIGSKDYLRKAINAATGQRKARIAKGPWSAQLVEEI